MVDGRDPARAGRGCRATASRCSTTPHRLLWTTTAGSRRATVRARTSTSSPTATTTPRRCAPSTPCPARRRCCRDGRSATGGAATTAYTADEYLALLDRFAAEGIPFSVAVLDMDWHLVDIDPRYGSGWTGYTWNTRAVPRPAGFLRRAAPARSARDAQRPPGRRRPGLRGRLPGDGAGAGPGPGQRASRSPSTSPTRPSSRPTSTCCTAGWRSDGVDFWWLDWQSGPYSRVAGIDPLWMLNHFHFLDSGRDGRPAADLLPLRRARQPSLPRRASPATPSSPGRRWTSSRSSPRPPRTSATAGGATTSAATCSGLKDDELATRWVQLGVFSPILRLHSALEPVHHARSRGRSGRRRDAGDDARAAAAAPAACPTCTR